MNEKITSIQVQKNNKDRVNIFINNEFAFGCDMELVYKHKLKVGSEIDKEMMSSIASNNDFAAAKASALRMIEKSYKTEKEIKDKLLNKEHSEEIINKVIDFLREYSFVDDDKYSQMYVNDKIKTRGKNKIKYDLLRKGIDEEIISTKLSDVNTEEEFETALNLASKKLKTVCLRESDERKIKQKLAQYLMGRGYTWDTINKVLKELVKNDNID